MQYQQLYQSIKKPYFTRADVLLRGLKIYDYQLSLWQRRGYIEKLKRGIYIFTARKKGLGPEEISFLMYEPSYLSLEFALSFYGLIPEMVYTLTAVTSRNTKKINNSSGNFTYRHVKQELFFGYKPRETKNGKYLFATPEKALLDYFYLNQHTLKSQDDIKELRINCEIFSKLVNKKQMQDYLHIYNSQVLTHSIHLLFTLCSHSAN